MSSLLRAIHAQAAAADVLTLTCTRRQFITPDEESLPPGVLPFRRSYRASLVTPMDMVLALGKIK